MKGTPMNYASDTLNYDVSIEFQRREFTHEGLYKTIIYEVVLNGKVYRQSIREPNYRSDAIEYPIGVENNIKHELCSVILKDFLNDIPPTRTKKVLSAEDFYFRAGQITGHMVANSRILILEDFLSTYLWYKMNPLSLEPWLISNIYKREYFEENHPEIFI